jgi:hypothetical protein
LINTSHPSYPGRPCYCNHDISNEATLSEQEQSNQRVDLPRGRSISSQLPSNLVIAPALSRIFHPGIAVAKVVAPCDTVLARIVRLAAHDADDVAQDARVRFTVAAQADPGYGRHDILVQVDAGDGAALEGFIAWSWGLGQCLVLGAGEMWGLRTSAGLVAVGFCAFASVFEAGINAACLQACGLAALRRLGGVRGAGEDLQSAVSRGVQVLVASYSLPRRLCRGSRGVGGNACSNGYRSRGSRPWSLRSSRRQGSFGLCFKHIEDALATADLSRVAGAWDVAVGLVRCPRVTHIGTTPTVSAGFYAGVLVLATETCGFALVHRQACASCIGRLVGECITVNIATKSIPTCKHWSRRWSCRGLAAHCLCRGRGDTATLHFVGHLDTVRKRLPVSAVGPDGGVPTTEVGRTDAIAPVANRLAGLAFIVIVPPGASADGRRVVLHIRFGITKYDRSEPKGCPGYECASHCEALVYEIS